MKCFIRYLKYMFNCLRYWKHPLFKEFYQPCTFKVYKLSVEECCNILRRIIRVQIPNDHRWDIERYIKSDAESTYDFYNNYYGGGCNENNKTM